MGLRIRQIKPDYWLDRDLATRLDAAAREFYIGLWMAADDAGFLEWDVVKLGAILYPFRSPDDREVDIATWADQLRALDPDDPHLIVLECGRHARVPKMPGHQRLAGDTKQVKTQMREHQNRCESSRIPAGPRESSPSRAPVGTERNGRRGTERNDSPPAPPPDGAAGGRGTFRAKVVANGGPDL